MTEQDRVTVNDPRGPVNNGEGPQYVFYGAGKDWMARRGVDYLRIAREDREYLADRFAPPAGYRDAAGRLAKPGSVVLLDAPPGSGRRAAAIMLLHELDEAGDTGAEQTRFEELPATDQDDSPPAPGAGDRFLLDLSGVTEEEAYARAQRTLALRRSQVQEAGAHMVVVLPARMEHAHAPDLEPHRVPLGRPRGIAVITRYLRMDKMVFGPADLQSADLQLLYDRSPMRELARLAGLVRAARDSGRFGTDFAGWLDQAMHAVSDRAGEVGRQVAEVNSTPERALLLAAAVFEEAHADTVYEAWHSLMRAVRHPEDGTTELAQTDFSQRFGALGIERGPDDRLRFGQLAYAEAVRTYFWANFPGLRDDLRDWISHAAGLRGLTTEEQVNAVVRFGERSLAVGRPEHLFDLVVRWADSAREAFCDPRAVAALELGLSHEVLGGWFRRRTYDCARSGPLSEGLTRVLTIACRQSLAPTHPDQAVVRLHHLAVRQGEAAAEARESLLDLVAHDRRGHRLLLGRLKDRALGNPRRAEPHLRLLTELLRSGRAPAPPPWPDLFRGLETVFSRPPTALWTPLVTSWLNAAADERTSETALKVMVRAARPHPDALHRLYTIGCAWAGTAPGRTAVAALLWQYIDEAQHAPTQRPGRTEPGPRNTEE
ncbi:hypothetical protein [Streptomyces sp. BBFR102]|uniref:hypothetical protein n=1 Tax=Streptomyces sp. BBFR102 TaxID=3448171 RepID=UPI003F53C821